MKNILDPSIIDKIDKKLDSIPLDEFTDKLENKLNKFDIFLSKVKKKMLDIFHVEKHSWTWKHKIIAKYHEWHYNYLAQRFYRKYGGRHAKKENIFQVWK